MLTVEPPIRDRSHGHAILEGLTSIKFQRLEGREASVAPTPDCHSLLINVLLLRPHLGDSNLVIRLVRSDVATSDATQFAT